MKTIKIRRGLDLPITGAPSPELDDAPAPARVALLGPDYVGMKPTMHVKPGDTVRRGQLVMEDKKTPGVRFTAPGGGRVVDVHRGERRVFHSVVIELDRAERERRGVTSARFSSYSGRHPDGLSRDDVKALLLESGDWPALRTRPFGRVAAPETTPRSIFVTAADSNPLAPDMGAILAGNEEDFSRGLDVLLRLTDGPVYVCTGPDLALDLPANERLQHVRFRGPHPSGTVGLHVHTLDPVDRNKLVWYAGLQDTIAIGHLFRTGEQRVERVVALCGPPVARPRLLRTRMGAATESLVQGELGEGDHRLVSGSVLSGRAAMGEDLGYLGRYHQQLSVLREDRERALLGWLAPGFNKYSIIPTFFSRVLPGKKFALTTSTQGSRREIVPIGMYEKVMPLDIMATQLVRALLMRDVEIAERLGVLELEEEDVALCTFVCPGKNDYGPLLRDVLTLLEKEG